MSKINDLNLGKFNFLSLRKEKKFNKEKSPKKNEVTELDKYDVDNNLNDEDSIKSLNMIIKNLKEQVNSQKLEINDLKNNYKNKT